MTRRCAAVLTLALLLALAGHALAHYCSNIFSGPAKFVVKAEKTVVPVSGSTQLRVWLQNNFPYKIFAVKMRGVATGYTINVSPASTVGQDIQPGQNVGYLFTITGPAGNLTVNTNLSLQVSFRVGSWRNNSDQEVSQSPTAATLIANITGGYTGGGEQSPSLSAAALADKFPTATLPANWFNRTGMQQLISWAGYRFCYSTSAYSMRSANDCPATTGEGTAWSSIDAGGQDFMRAVAEVGARKTTLGSYADAARAGMTNALKNGSTPSTSCTTTPCGSVEHKCLAAVVGATLWQGLAATTFTDALTNTVYKVPAVCQSAAAHVLGVTLTGVSALPATCPSTNYYEEAACAAAKVLTGDDSAAAVLKTKGGDGASSDTGGVTYGISLYYSYMLYIVAAQRRATTGGVSFYPDAGGATGDLPPPPPPDVTPWPDKPQPDRRLIDLPRPDQRRVDQRPPDQRRPDQRPPDKPKPVLDQPKPLVDQPPRKDTLLQPDTVPTPDRRVIVGDNGKPVVVDLAPVERGASSDRPASREAGTSSTLDGGCGCRVASDAPFSPVPLLGLLALAGWLARRRRS